MTTRPSPASIPRAALFAGGAAIALSILAAAIGRVEGPVQVVAPADPVEIRALYFRDADDGTITVTDAATGALLDRVAYGEGGFIRGSLRGLARDRGRRGIGIDPPFQLQRLADGRLVLHDPALDRTIDLAAFGSTNRDAYARLLAVPAGGTRTSDAGTAGGGGTP